MDRSIHPYFLDRLFFCSPSHCIIESEIDNGRAKISGYGFLGIAGFFDRLFPWMGGSFQPRSSQLHREEKFNFSSSTLIYPHAGGYHTDIYTDELVVARFIFTGYFRLDLPWIDSIAVSIPSSNLFPCTYVSTALLASPLQETGGHCYRNISVSFLTYIYIYCRYFSKFIPNTIN